MNEGPDCLSSEYHNLDEAFAGQAEVSGRCTKPSSKKDYEGRGDNLWLQQISGFSGIFMASCKAPVQYSKKAEHIRLLIRGKVDRDLSSAHFRASP
jgi:hypothetical protein